MTVPWVREQDVVSQETRLNAVTTNQPEEVDETMGDGLRVIRSQHRVPVHPERRAIPPYVTHPSSPKYGWGDEEKLWHIIRERDQRTDGPDVLCASPGKQTDQRDLKE